MEVFRKNVTRTNILKERKELRNSKYNEFGGWNMKQNINKKIMVK